MVDKTEKLLRINETKRSVQTACVSSPSVGYTDQKDQAYYGGYKSTLEPVPTGTPRPDAPKCHLRELLFITDCFITA